MSNPKYLPMQILRDNIKLVVRPWQDLTKEIDIDGKWFIPMEVLFEMEHPNHKSDFRKYYYEDYPNWTSCSHNGTAAVTKVYKNRIEENPYWMVQKLKEWHFYFGIIEKGLVINLNSI
ncbi:hypothetical protein [Aquirufa ecclesiirivi]|uniref:hypothetical protein n=1 Tax=Aquirufa ecclesiirivi TaxID=2715124 RepID=UPI003BAE4E94